MDKRLRQIVKLIKKLPNSPRSLNTAKYLIDSYRMNFRFETMTQKGHHEYIYGLEQILIKFRDIRGR